MKKALLLSMVFLLSVAGTGLAKDLQGVAGIDLSQGVVGVYFSDPASGPVNFAISTGHQQGTKVYATSNFSTAIYTKDISGDVFASTDLLSDPSTTFDSTIFSAWTEI